ncbi:MAG: heme o synthase [Alphaproteobacteria bacterium]|nr:heme o synthase [Alphaproteobacteria bacterium]
MIQTTHLYNSDVFDYWQLLKPRVMSLVIFTGLCGMLAAPGQIHPILGFTAILSLAIGAGAAGCLNMWWEKDSDALMKRTADRPLPAGRVDPDTALAFGIIMACGSVLTMMVAVNLVAASLLAFTIFYYIIIYTNLLKPRTPQNIVIGGAAGALPPVIGWASVTGTAPIEAWSLFLIIFLWTPAHFWALSLHCSEDYKKAGIPMLPCVKGVDATKRQIFIYTLLTVISSYLPCYLDIAQDLYLVVASILGIGFIGLAIAVCYFNKSPLSLFSYSIFYLFFLFLGLVIGS